MVLCKFFQQGNCRFGNNCRFEHVRPNDNRGQPSNRFGALGGGGRGGSGGGEDALEKYGISVDMIEKDLTSERPEWILSAYAPGRLAPDQLFGGYPREQSFEEMRLHYLTGKNSGNEQQALNQAQQLYQTAEQQMQTALQNSRQAATYVVEAENKHPNRHDICKQGTQGAPFGEFLVGKRPKSLVPDAAPANPFSSGTSTSPFGGASAAAGSAFGQPSALGQRPNPFGQPSQSASFFGQPQAASGFGQQTQTTSAFGQPSALGAKPNPFGAPSLGQPSAPAAQGSTFGQTSQPGPQGTQGSAFGQPSALGAQGTQGSAFGQPSQLGAQGSAFGQPSQLGQRPNPFSGAANTGPSPFASNAGSAAPASNAFGSTANNTANPNPFASAGGNSGGSAGPNPFSSAPANPGQASSSASAQTSSPFGQPAPASANPFASAGQGPTPDAQNPFAQRPQQQQQQQQQPNGVFGRPSGGSNPFGQNTNTSANPFGTAPAAPGPQQAPENTGPSNPYPPGSSRQHPALDSYAARNLGQLVTFKGKAVKYRDAVPGVQDFGGPWARVWFPDGPPAYYKETELPPEAYDARSREQWAVFAQTGAFQGGLMPELPPPREVTQWDF